MTHTEVITDTLAALTRRDLPALLDEHLTEDVEIDSWLAAVEGQRHYEGRAGVERWYETILEAWETFATILEDVIELGDHALALVRIRARGRGSGAEVDRQIGVVYEIRADRIASLRVFPEPADALEDLARRLRQS